MYVYMYIYMSAKIYVSVGRWVGGYVLDGGGGWLAKILLFDDKGVAEKGGGG